MSTLDHVADSKPRPAGHDEPLAAIRPIRVRLVRTLTAFGVLAVVTCLLAPLVGSAPISLGARLRSVDPVQRQRGRANLLRREDASHLCRGARRGRTGHRRRRVSGAAAKRAGDAVHARRLGGCVARSHARDRLRRGGDRGTVLGGAAGQPCRRGDRRRHRLPAGDDAGPGDVHDGPAPRRRDAELVLLGPDLFVQYIADFAQVYRATRWIMGDLDVGSFEPIVAALPMMVDRLRDLRAGSPRR